MGFLLVTAPCGKEEAAELEVLDCIIHRDPGASFIPHSYRGLLILNTKLSSDEAAKLVKDCPTAYICKIIPVDATIKSDLPSIIECVTKLIPRDSRSLRVECKRRGQYIKSSYDVELAVGAALKDLGHTVNFRSPERIVRIDIIGEWTTISVGSPERYFTKLRGKIL
ncbi:MAG: THUMP domain-containing protein [Candidatus Methanomethylicaceae archaeon]